MCGASTSYLHPELPLDGHHFCGIFSIRYLHSPCGVYLGNDPYHNSCLSCIEKICCSPQLLPPSTQDQSYVVNDNATADYVAAAKCPSQVLKCSLQQSKNTDAAAPQFICGFKDCEKTIH
jgi:hypothetical protein